MIDVHGYAALNAQSPLTPFRFSRREVGRQDVLIKIRYCGICHSDVHQARDEWGESLFPMVPGHEIVGTVLSHSDKKQADAKRLGAQAYYSTAKPEPLTRLTKQFDFILAGC